MFCFLLPPRLTLGTRSRALWGNAVEEGHVEMNSGRQWTSISIYDAHSIAEDNKGEGGGVGEDDYWGTTFYSGGHLTLTFFSILCRRSYCLYLSQCDTVGSPRRTSAILYSPYSSYHDHDGRRADAAGSPAISLCQNTADESSLDGHVRGPQGRRVRGA